MKNTNNALDVLKNEKFEITDLKSFTPVFIYIKQLKKVIEQLEKKAAEKGYQLMSEQEESKIELENFVIIKKEPTNSQEYRARSVIEALGLERAIPLLKVDKKMTDTYLNMGLKNGAVTWEETRKCREGMKNKTKKGCLQLRTKN